MHYLKFLYYAKILLNNDSATHVTQRQAILF